MAKALFRFLRGELNGYYITNLYNSFNEYSSDIKRFFIEFQNQQFELGKISDETLYNLGKFASVFLPRRPVAESRTSLYMTDSHEVDGVEYSERGLFDTENESFEFVHTDPSIETPDINTLATDTKRSSLVGDETAEGYISSEETDVLDDNGMVRPQKVSVTPPDVPYSEFYGNQFLFLSEGDVTYETIAPSLFIELFKAMQWIRYNGASIASLARIIATLCPEGLVKISRNEVASDGRSVYIYYVYDSSSPVANKESRLALLEYLVNLKFKQVQLVEEE
jgi:hypothetical protein